MKAINGKGQPRPDPRGHDAQRRGLLAKVHIAKNDLGVSDYAYEEILDCQFRVDSAAVLTIRQLESLVRYFEQRGWKAARGQRTEGRGQRTEGRRQRTEGGRQMTDGRGQVEALRERIMHIAWSLDNGEKRLQGLVEKICKVDRLEWCWDVGRLKQVLAAFKKIADLDNR
jgi:hypothetical protein